MISAMKSNVIFAKLDPGFFRSRKVIKAGRNGRDAFLHALCVNAGRGGHGWIPAEDMEPWYIASQLAIAIEDAEDGVTKAVTAKLLRFDGETVVIVGWDQDWGRRALSRAEIQKNYRDRQSRKDGNQSECYEDEVTIVTAESNVTDQRRGEERRESHGNNSLSLPGDFEPSERARTIADKRRLDLAFELVQFRDYAAAREVQSANWEASFCTWLRKSRDVDRKPDKPRSPKAKAGAHVTRQRNGQGITYVLHETDGNMREISAEEASKYEGRK